MIIQAISAQQAITMRNNSIMTMFQNNNHLLDVIQNASQLSLEDLNDIETQIALNNLQSIIEYKIACKQLEPTRDKDMHEIDIKA